jgi:hypothetical protein
LGFDLPPEALKKAGTDMPESRKVIGYHKERRTSGAKAVWHPQGEPPLEYADFDLVPTLAFNFSPGQTP